MKIIILVTLLLIPSSVSAQALDVATDVSIGSGIVLQVVDMNLTTFLTAKNLGKEANPVFAPYVNNPILAPVIKGSIAVGASYLMLKYKKTNPVIVFISSLAVNGFYIYVVQHNAQIAKGHY